MTNSSNINILTTKTVLNNEEFYELTNIYTQAYGVTISNWVLDWFIKKGLKTINNTDKTIKGILKEVNNVGVNKEVIVNKAVVQGKNKAVSYVVYNDNDYPVISFNLIDNEIIFTKKKEIVKIYPLTIQGTKEAKQYILDQIVKIY